MSKKLFVALVMALVAVCVFAAGISELDSASKAQSVVVTDMVGREVEDRKSVV